MRRIPKLEPLWIKEGATKLTTKSDIKRWSIRSKWKLWKNLLWGKK